MAPYPNFRLPESSIGFNAELAMDNWEKGENAACQYWAKARVVGESGCGKSTIAGILSAKNRGYSGKISMGGIPLSEINEENLMKHMVLVRHNSYLFKRTVVLVSHRMSTMAVTDVMFRMENGRIS